MALRFDGIENEVVEKMYDVVIEGHKWSFNEEMTQKVINFMNGLKTEGTVKVSTPVEKTAYKPHSVNPSDVTCKWNVEQLTGVDKDGKRVKFYHIVDGIFTAGKWMQSKFNADEEFRIPTNQEAHRIALNKVKDLKDVECFKMDGGWNAYGYKTKKTALEMIEQLPDKIQGVEIAGYIEKYGKIQVKSVKRQKTA